MFAQKAAYLAGLLVLSGVVLAAEPAPQNCPHDVSQRDVNAMQVCRSRCLSVLKQADETIKAIDDAKNSNDVDQMRSALERARKVFVDARNAQDECLALRYPGSSERARKLMEKYPGD